MVAGEKLLILLKAPRRGLVKTRLASELDEDSALAIYQELLDIVISRMESLQDVELHYSPADADAQVASFLKPGWKAYPQTEGDLGVRIQNAFAQAFQRGGQRVVMIGADCPEVCASDISDAWSALTTRDLALGPATDGGYWLIGLSKPQPHLFTEIRWSTDTVLTKTLALAQTSGLTHHLLRPLSDVDTQADWKNHLARRSAQRLASVADFR
ncbi:MAG: PGL/p-HBAD biosynthesis glycosyltransferase [Verrucomicrobia bacterium]|jgi:rSAM/selenodomain-associated transferase 1|nr:PGL/p-HBAD biosynthesis glycosyltransferase [Verrucomicrobiota bacterium]